MQNQKGFTLIELIIVIVILGILAVTAAPKFFNLSSDARAATVKALAGEIKGAANIVYASAAVRGLDAYNVDNTDAQNPVYKEVNGVKIIYGYPAAIETGIPLALELGADNEDWGVEVVTEAGSEVVKFHAKGRFTVNGTNVTGLGSDKNPPVGCYVAYKNATLDANNQLIAPAVDTKIDGC